MTEDDDDDRAKSKIMRGRKRTDNDMTGDPEWQGVLDAAAKAQRDKQAIEGELRRTQAELEAVKGALRTCARVLGPYEK